MREARAAARAAKLPKGEYYAASNDVVNRETRKPAVCCETHWDACLVLIAFDPKGISK